MEIIRTSEMLEHQSTFAWWHDTEIGFIFYYQCFRT